MNIRFEWNATLFYPCVKCTAMSHYAWTIANALCHYHTKLYVR